MKRWYADSERFVVDEVACDEVGYPHKDAAGRTQWDNSHFDDERSAWLFLKKEAEAAVFLTLKEINDIDARRRRLVKNLVGHAEAQQRVRLAMEERWGRD